MGGGRNVAFHVKETTAHIKANLVECRLKQHTVFENSQHDQRMKLEKEAVD